MIRKMILLSTLVFSLFTGCNNEEINELKENLPTVSETISDESVLEIVSKIKSEKTIEKIESEIITEEIKSKITTEEIKSEIATEEIKLETTSEETAKYTVVIDPGHQRKGSSVKEPVGPGAKETKARVTGGTYGAASGLSEYELNLQIAFKLKNLLEEKGYNVIMTRESNDVDISNSERAEIANNANADAFVRIHANGSENKNKQGAMTICQTSKNPFNSECYSESYELSENILNELVNETGCKSEGIWETDTMSGINWAKVPSTIVEVGYMTNSEEDLKLASENYQDMVATGIVKGIEKFLEKA